MYASHVGTSKWFIQIISSAFAALLLHCLHFPSLVVHDWSRPVLDLILDMCMTYLFQFILSWGTCEMCIALHLQAKSNYCKWDWLTCTALLGIALKQQPKGQILLLFISMQALRRLIRCWGCVCAFHKH